MSPIFSQDCLVIFLIFLSPIDLIVGAIDFMHRVVILFGRPFWGLRGVALWIIIGMSYYDCMSFSRVYKNCEEYAYGFKVRLNWDTTSDDCTNLWSTTHPFTVTSRKDQLFMQAISLFIVFFQKGLNI